MSFSIDFDDSEFRRQMEVLEDSISPATINAWAKRIENDARISGKDIRIEILGQNVGSFTIKCQKGEIPIVERSFDRLIPEMPQITAKFFKKALRALKTKTSTMS